MVSLKFMRFSEVKKISWYSFKHTPGENFFILAPFLGYVIFGLGNIYFFSIALKHIAASTAFAVWMGLALIGMRLLEIFFFKSNYSVMDYFYMMLIVIAVIGLKKT